MIVNCLFLFLGNEKICYTKHKFWIIYDDKQYKLKIFTITFKLEKLKKGLEIYIRRGRDVTRKEVFEYISHSAEIALQEIGLFTGNLAIQAFAVSPAIIYKIVSG